jgi:hypothetical protein
MEGDPVSKNISCPYFLYEKDRTIVCEAGSIRPMLRDNYICDYCASMNYKNCTMARILTLCYEQPQQNKPKDSQPIDWVELRSEYINSDISLRRLAARRNISFFTLKTRCRTEGWVNEKIARTM